MTMWLQRTTGEMLTGMRNGFRVIGERLSPGYVIAIVGAIVWFVSR